jgi:GT2 family glycosyltransferase
MPGTPRVSFVILSHNSSRFLARCLESVLVNPSDEVWVVDNGSRDASPTILEGFKERHPGQFHLTRLPGNVGTTVSRNLALRQVTGHFVAVIDSDIVMPPGAVDALLEWFTPGSHCGIVAPRLIRADGSFQLSADVFPTLPRKIHRAVRLRSIERAASQSVSQRPCTVDYAISACWLMRRELFDVVGLLDERIFYAPEDADYCVRVWKAGFQVVYDPRVEVLHDAQEISRRPGRAAWLHAKGLLYYFRKHQCLLSSGRLRREVRDRYGEERLSLEAE